MDKFPSNNRSIGDSGEMLACEYLESKGYTILERNYQIKGGEIDIVAYTPHCTIFVEVKYRKDELHGHPLETFTLPKRRALKRTIFAYIHKNNIDPDTIRVDFIGILGIRPNHEVFHVEGVEL